MRQIGNKPRLFLHVGVHRTGTSSIQRVLQHNRQRLASAGILYPQLEGERRHRYLFQHFSSWGARQKAACLSALTTPVPGGLPVQTVLLSDEDFVRILWRSTRLLAFLKQHFDVQILLYLRRQDLWLESWYNQNIKWPWVRSLSQATPEQFLKSEGRFPWIDYRQLIDKLLRVVAPEQLSVAVMSAHDVLDTRAHFLASTGMTAQVVLDRKKHRQNQSVSAARLEAIRRVGLFDVPKKVRNRVLNFVRDYDLHGDNGTTSIFTDGQRRAIMARYMAGNASVCRDFFSGQDVFGPIEGTSNCEASIAEADIELLAATLRSLIDTELSDSPLSWWRRLLSR